MARATAAEVSEELGGAIDATDVNQRWLDRAHRLVEARAPAGLSEAELEDAEILVAAHVIYPRVTGAATGAEVSSVSEGEATVKYETAGVGPNGVESPFWPQAVRAYPWLAEDDDEFFVTTL